MGLNIENLSAKLSKTAVLNNINAALRSGEMSVILGPNGAGKSSLIRCMAGLLKPSAGRITLDGMDIAGLDPPIRARRIGYLPQSTELVWNLPSREIVALGRYPWRTPFSAPGPEDEEAIAAAMRATDTAQFADRLVKDLSGGERARVLLARVLAGKPDWILADEPLASLDPAHQRDMLILLKKAAAAGVGVVLIVHDLNHAMRVADQVLMLKEGELRYAGLVVDVMQAQTIVEIFEIEAEIVINATQTPNFIRLLS